MSKISSMLERGNYPGGGGGGAERRDDKFRVWWWGKDRGNILSQSVIDDANATRKLAN